MRCFFIGHWEAPCTLRPALEEAVERHITTLGVTEFLVGGYGAFDRACRRLCHRRQAPPRGGHAFPAAPLSSAGARGHAAGRL